MGEQKGSLRTRITRTIISGISIILLTFSIASYYIVNKNIEDSLGKKLSLARMVRNNIDNIMKDNISRLYDISLSGKVDLTDDTFAPEREAIRVAYRYSIFTDGVFLLDTQGNVILNYPERIRDTAINIMSVEPVGRSLAQGKPVVSNIYTVEPSKKKVLFVLVPLKDKSGNDIGVAGGEIDPTNPALTRMLGLVEIGPNTFIDIVDTNGVIISSSDSSRTLTQCNREKFFTRMITDRTARVSTCHHCHSAGSASEKQTMILAFVPLETAPWGISIQEPEEEVFTPALKLKRAFVTLAVIFIGTAFILTIGISRSIVDPLKELIKGADRIARGDMNKPISPQGSDEIGTLSQSFEIMRLRLVESMARIQRHTHELEDRVAERTRQIRESRNRAGFLLQKIIKTQEDERMRIARELHDETLQDLSAALMKIDMCMLMPDRISREQVDEMHCIVLKALDGVTAIIQNLRPSLLDDLGLSAAVKSLLDIHLVKNGIQCFMTLHDVLDTRFPREVETSLFRIIQEAIMNIARHARAENVFVICKTADNAIHIEIEDDGLGFDQDMVSHPASQNMQDRRGLGILGMKERAFLINGEINVCSLLGLGTRIKIHIPLRSQEDLHA